MTGLTRRTLLKQAPVAVAATAIPATTAAAACQPEAEQENPVLLAAYRRFLDTQAELAAAQDALEWLADEWKHLWPMAPEDILFHANADEYTANAERDIIGRLLVRDTSDLTKKTTRAWREKYPRACFSVPEPDWFQEVVDKWETPRAGKTEQALARNLAEQARVLSEYRRKLHLSKEYHAEIARLRAASGVQCLKDRVSAAKAELGRAALCVSKAEALTLHGLCMKAEVLKADNLVEVVLKQDGILGHMARFIEATLAIAGRTAA